MAEYNEEEIKLAKRIYDATMIVSGGVTSRKMKNFSKKFGFPLPNEMPDVLCLEIARTLLKHYEDEMDKNMRKAVEAM
jgi:hypothetical protein